MIRLLLLPLLAATGCFWATTKSEGQLLRKDVKELQARFGGNDNALDSQVAQLKKVLDEATKLLKRNSADLGADVDQLRGDVRTASGLVTAVNQSINELKSGFDAYRKQTDSKLDALEQRLAQLETGKPSSAASPDELWKLGSAAFEAGRFADAVEIFKRLHQNHPNHDRADDAIYFKGQSYTNLREWEKAIGSYQQLADKYPDGALTDDGYYFAARAAQQLKQCGEARAYLDLLKKRYGKSNVLRQAAELEAQLKKDLKNKSKCV